MTYVIETMSWLHRWSGLQIYPFEAYIISNIFYYTYINENIYMVDCSSSKQQSVNIISYSIRTRICLNDVLSIMSILHRRYKSGIFREARVGRHV